MYKQYKFMACHLFQMCDRHLPAEPQDTRQQPAACLSFKRGRQHCEPTDEQPQHTQKTASISLNRWSTTGRQPIDTWAI